MVTPHAAGFRRARAEITGWEGYASTRLLDLPPPGTIRLKDESGLETFMAGLACGEPGLLAWRELECSATAFMGIPDAAAIDTMRFLADQGIVAGESGAVGLASAAGDGGQGGVGRSGPGRGQPDPDVQHRGGDGRGGLRGLDRLLIRSG